MKVVLADLPMAHLKGEPVTESPNLGILYLISYARKRLPSVEFVYLEPFLTEEEHLRRVKEIQPDVYGVSFTTTYKKLAYNTINKVTGVTNALIIAGGVHPTLDHLDVFKNSNTDICVIGEGEETFCEILQNRMNGKAVKNVAGSISRGCDQNPPRLALSDLDFFPAWDIVDFTKYSGSVWKKFPFAYVLPARGCPYHCVFCSNPVWRLQKPWVRLRAPKNIADEIAMLYSRGVREIYIRCDTFNVDLKWATDVCREIEKLGLKDLLFQCQLRADKLSEDFVSELKTINCWLVHIGIESANDRVLKGIDKRISVQGIENALELLKKHNIDVYGFFMLYNVWEERGELFWETTDEVKNTLNFAKKMLDSKLLTYISWAITKPIIGSRLYDIAKKYNLINDSGSRFPMRIPQTSVNDMLENYGKGLALQLWNGFNTGIIKPGDVRAERKFRTLVNVLVEELGSFEKDKKK